MAEENKDSLSEQNENDYGFPFVEVTPLKAKAGQKPSIEQENLEKPVSVARAETKEELPQFEKQIVGTSSEKGRKKSQLPLQFSLVMLILIILAAMAYFLYFLPETETVPVITETVESSEEMIPEATSAPSEDPVAEREEEALQEEEETNMEEIISPSPVNAQTFGEIFQVRQRSTPIQYYIIIASMPSEDLAIDRAEELQSENRDVWVIYPYGETSNYRLSIGKYTAFEEATQALENFKADFGASIWILKY